MVSQHNPPCQRRLKLFMVYNINLGDICLTTKRQLAGNGDPMRGVYPTYDWNSKGDQIRGRSRHENQRESSTKSERKERGHYEGEKSQKS